MGQIRELRVASIQEGLHQALKRREKGMLKIDRGE